MWSEADDGDAYSRGAEVQARQMRRRREAEVEASDGVEMQRRRSAVLILRG